MHDSIIVLHVDDEPAFLDQTEIFLEKEEEELDVTTVQSPTKGLELLEERDFDVIVSDYQMPDMDGLELLRVVREERESKIPFIILTGKGREEVAMKALNLGADRYLQKGGDPKTLFCVLAQAIKQEYESFEKEKEPKISVREKSKIFDSTVEHVLYQNLDHDILWANKAAGDSIGEDPEDLIGRKCYEIWHDREEECKNCPVQDAIESGEIERGEVRSPDGRYWIITGNPITDEEGDLQGVVEVTLEITAMKEKEKRLEASEERYRRLFETAQDGMLILNAESGKIKDANPYIQDLIGYSKEELVGRKLWEIGTFKSVVENRERFQELVEEGYIRYEDLPLETKGGEEAPVEFVSNTYEAGGEEVVQCNIRDVSERKEAEKELKTERDRTEVILDNLPGYAFILEKDSREIIYSNDKAKEVGAVPGETCFENVAERDDPCPFCKAPETWETDERREIEIEYRGTYYYGIWIPYTDDLYVHYIFDITERKKAERQIEENEEKLEKLHQISAELETCDSQEEVYSLVVKVAERVLDLDICAINVPDGDVMKATAVSSEFPEGASSVKKPLPIDDSLAGKTYREKRSFLVRDKKENKYVNPTSDEFVSGISVPIGDFAVFQACSNKVDDFDEDDLKMTELLMDHVSQALKRVEIKEREEFLHSLLRHDVQNKTQLVKGYLHLLEEDVDVPDEAKDYIQKAKKVTRLSDEIIEKVRKLKQIAQKDEIGEVEIDPVLDQVLSEHESQLEKESIAFKVKTSRCKVKGGALLQEAISNLIENSILHSDCDKIRIQAGCEEGECVVTVEDDGKGISDEVKEKIFDRGFKKGENAGSGLGMYLVKDIVESYGGSVEAKDSELGGARFDVHLHRME